MLLGIPVAGQALTATVADRRVDLDGVLEVREIFETHGGAPHDRTLESLRLHLRVDLADWLRFDASTLASNGGPRFRATKTGSYNFDDVFQDVDPSVEIEEAHFDLDFDSLEIRIGKQKFHWGKLDRVQPNDLLNPYRYDDPFLFEQDERKIGVPSIQLEYASPAPAGQIDDPSLTLVWQPAYIPFRYPQAGERWFPPAAVPPSVFSIPTSLLGLSGQDSVDIPVTFAARNTAAPARRLDHSTVAVRAAGLYRGIDLAAYYFHGFDIQPAFQLLAEASGTANPQSPLGVDVAARTILEPAFSRIDAWGADAAYTIDPFAVRVEGTFVRNRPFSRDLRLLITDPAQLQDEIRTALAMLRAGHSSAPIDLGASYSVRDAVEWGAGVDYTYDGWFGLLQVNQTDVLANDDQLLINDVETRLLANLRKSFWQETLRAQLIAVHAIERDYSLLLPRLTYALTDHADVRVGYLAITGSRHSTIGQYTRNDQGFVRFRLTF